MLDLELYVSIELINLSLKEYIKVIEFTAGPNKYFI